MFVDMAGGGGPRLPEPPKPRLSRKGERVMIALLLLNAFMLLIAPIGGATLVAGLAALFR